MVINLTQHLEYETDSLDSFEKMLDTVVRVTFHEKLTENFRLFLTRRSRLFGGETKFYGQRKVDPLHPRQNPEPMYFHVCSVADCKKEAAEGDEKFAFYSQLVQSVMDCLKNADAKQFFRKCGGGYHCGFNEKDGAVGCGYRLSHHSSGGWNRLDVSLCHIYYGSKPFP